MKQINMTPAQQLLLSIACTDARLQQILAEQKKLQKSMDNRIAKIDRILRELKDN